VQRAVGFSLTHQRLPDGRAKQQILRAVDQARTCMPLRALLRLLRLSPSRFHAWQRQDTCALDDQSSCPRASPHRLTPAEVRAVEELVTSPRPPIPNGSASCGPRRYRCRQAKIRSMRAVRSVSRAHGNVASVVSRPPYIAQTLDDENSCGNLQNVRGDSWVRTQGR
jgi:hypothetical protein